MQSYGPEDAEEWLREVDARIPRIARKYPGYTVSRGPRDDLGYQTVLVELPSGASPEYFPNSWSGVELTFVAQDLPQLESFVAVNSHLDGYVIPKDRLASCVCGCGTRMMYDRSDDSFGCRGCGSSCSASPLASVASRVASVSVEASKRGRPLKKRRKKRQEVSLDSFQDVSQDVLTPSTEYACRMEFDITANFEGTADKRALIRKIKSELLASVKASMTSVARSMNLSSQGVTVRPLRLECDVNDL